MRFIELFGENLHKGLVSSFFWLVFDLHYLCYLVDLGINLDIKTYSKPFQIIN